MDFFHYAVSFIVALAVSAGLMPAVIRLAGALGAVDRPGGRRVHVGPIPRLGGIGIFLGFVAGAGAATLLAGRAERFGDAAEYRWVGIIVGQALIFVAGLLDDLYDFRPRTKLFFQVLAAGIAVSAGFRVEVVTSPFGGEIALGWAGPFLALAWILLVTNAINLIDGLDGLAGGLALIVTTTVAAVALTMDQFGVVISAMALAGCLLGFLRYNFHPARIFMGDGGSQFLGYTLAVIAIRGSQKGATAVAILVPLLALGLPLMDLATTVARRARRDDAGGSPAGFFRRISRPDREHLHHNLLDLGLSPRRAALALHLVAALFALAGYLSVARNSIVLAALTLTLPIGSVVLIKVALAGQRSRLRSEGLEDGPSA